MKKRILLIALIGISNILYAPGTIGALFWLIPGAGYALAFVSACIFVPRNDHHAVLMSMMADRDYTVQNAARLRPPNLDLQPEPIQPPNRRLTDIERQPRRSPQLINNEQKT